MLNLLATGHTWRGGDGPYTITPLVGLLLTLILIRFVLRFPLGVPALAASALLGTLFATASASWGYTITLSVWTLSFLLIAGRLRRTRGAFGGNPPD
jgi:hypothetical protein